MYLIKDQQEGAECVQGYNNGYIHPFRFFNIPAVWYNLQVFNKYNFWPGFQAAASLVFPIEESERLHRSSVVQAIAV